MTALCVRCGHSEAVHVPDAEQDIYATDRPLLPRRCIGYGGLDGIGLPFVPCDCPRLILEGVYV